MADSSGLSFDGWRESSRLNYRRRRGPAPARPDWARGSDGCMARWWCARGDSNSHGLADMFRATRATTVREDPERVLACTKDRPVTRRPAGLGANSHWAAR